MTDDEMIRARIKVDKAAREHVRWQGVLGKFLGQMEDGRTYSMEDIEVIIEKAGSKFTFAGPATTYAVREGYLNRVGKGRYVATGKKLGG